MRIFEPIYSHKRRDSIHNVYTRGVNSTEISGPARKFFCSARPGINILQNLYNGLTMGGGRTKTHENFVKYGYNF